VQQETQVPANDEENNLEMAIIPSSTHSYGTGFILTTGETSLILLHESLESRLLDV
jgi:hypothetical protein